MEDLCYPFKWGQLLDDEPLGAIQLLHQEDKSQGRMLQQTDTHEVLLEVAEGSESEGRFTYTIVSEGLDKGQKGLVLDDGTKSDGRFRTETVYQGRFEVKHAHIEWHDWYEMFCRGREMGSGTPASFRFKCYTHPVTNAKWSKKPAPPTERQPPSPKSYLPHERHHTPPKR